MDKRVFVFPLVPMVAWLSLESQRAKVTAVQDCQPAFAAKWSQAIHESTAVSR